MRRIKALLWFAMSIVTACLIVGFTLGPGMVDRRFNPVREQSLSAIAPITETLHQSLTVVDLHADSLLWGRNLDKRSDIGHVDIPRMADGNVALQVFASVTKVPSPLQMEGNTDKTDDIIKLALLQRWPLRTWNSLLARSLFQAERLKRAERESNGTFEIIKTQGQLRAYLDGRDAGETKTAGLLSVEGAQVIEGKLENIERLYDAGFRMVGLTHFFDTEVAGSAHGISGGGLTALGVEAIDVMESNGMIIDLAHSSAQTIDDVLEIAQRPVVVSHTGVQGTCDGPRNLSDRQIEKIAGSGGLIGIGFWTTAVCGEDVGSIVRAIQYVADTVGVEHVALGSDFDGSVSVPFDAGGMAQMTQGLKDGGFSDRDIEQIMGGNVVRLLLNYLPE